MNSWQDAEEHAQQAHRYFRAGQWQRALDELNEALEQRPDQGEWHFGLGLTLDALHRYDEAATAFAKAVAFGGEEPAALLHLGVDQIRSGQAGAAIETLERLNQLEPLCEMGYVHRVLACAQAGRHDEAEVMFYLARDVAENADRDDASPAALAGAGGPEGRAAAHDHLAQSLLLRRPADPDRAVWCWQEALRHDARHPTAGRHLARTLQKRGQTERAAGCFAAHLDERPDDTATRLEYADLLLETGQRGRAGDQYRRVLRAEPTLAAAHQRLGELALASGHPAAARDRFRRAQELEPRRPGVRLGLARAEWMRGRRDRARTLLHGELRCRGHAPAQLIGVAELLVGLSCFHDAVGVLDALLAPPLDAPRLPGKPTSAAPFSALPSQLPLADDSGARVAALRWRGIARLALKQTGPGLDDLRRAVRLEPRDITALTHLAGAALAAGDLPGARHWITQGRAAAPRHAALRRLRLRWWTGRLRHAARRLTRIRPGSRAV